MPYVPLCRPAVPGDLGPGQRDRGVDQVSRVTRDCTRGLAVSTRLPGRPGAVPEGTLGGSAVLGNLGLYPRPRSVDQTSRATLSAQGSTSCPGTLAFVSEGLRGQPAVPGEWGSGPKALGVDQLSWATQARALGPAVSTNSPGRLGFGSDGPWSTSCPGSLAPMPDVPRGRPAAPGDSGLYPRAHGVDHLSRAPRARVQGPTGSTKCSGRLLPRSDGPHGRPNVPGNSGSGPRAFGVDQQSRATRVLFRGLAGWTNSPG